MFDSNNTSYVQGVVVCMSYKSQLLLPNKDSPQGIAVAIGAAGGDVSVWDRPQRETGTILKTGPSRWRLGLKAEGAGGQGYGPGKGDNFTNYRKTTNAPVVHQMQAGANRVVRIEHPHQKSEVLLDGGRMRDTEVSCTSGSARSLKSCV